MTSVRLSPRLGTPLQGPPAARPVSGTSAPVKKAVDAFERKPVTVAPSLQRGATGGAVTGLQQKLMAGRFMSNEDYRSGPGVYGPRTEAAVKRLQAHVGLPVTGVAGPSTMAALSSGARFQQAPVEKPVVHAKLSETFTEEVTQPMGVPL